MRFFRSLFRRIPLLRLKRIRFQMRICVRGSELLLSSARTLLSVQVLAERQKATVERAIVTFPHNFTFLTYLHQQRWRPLPLCATSRPSTVASTRSRTWPWPTSGAYAGARDCGKNRKRRDRDTAASPPLPGDGLDALARPAVGLDRPDVLASRADSNDGRASARVLPDTPQPRRFLPPLTARRLQTPSTVASRSSSRRSRCPVSCP